MRLVTAGGIVKSQRGNIIIILHQLAHIPDGKTIISSIQAESFGITIDDRSSKLKRGNQVIQTPDGYTIPLNFVNGLPYVPIRPFSDHEWETLPHIPLTSYSEWGPSSIDTNLTDDEYFLNNIPFNTTNLHESQSYYTNPTPVSSNFYLHQLHLIKMSFNLNMQPICLR